MLDLTAVKDALENGRELAQVYSYVNEKDADELSQTLVNILNVVKREDLSDELNYILSEMVINANKANLKQVHFKEHKLDIHQPDQYETGMENFAKQIQSDSEKLISKFTECGLKTQVIFKIVEGVFQFRVVNNRCALPQETARIKSILNRFSAIRNTLEAFDTVSDTHEGANLGTISSLLMLRRIGLDENAYFFESDAGQNETTVGINIPINTITNEQGDLISEDIAKEILSLPEFPEKISRLQRMIVEGEADFIKIAALIESDMALTAELLRIVNSAQYMLPQKVGNIQNALSLIGIKGLKSLLYSYGTQQILDKNYGHYDQIWKHSFKTASFAYHLAREFNLSILRDDAYIGGILHDIGKILIIYCKPGLLESIRKHCRNRGNEDVLLEKLSIGGTHAIIGAGITARWNFPEFLTSIIRYHHSPLLAPDADQKLVSIVYLANLLCQIQDGNFTYSSVDKNVLKKFQVHNLEQLKEIEQRLDMFYTQQIEKENP